VLASGLIMYPIAFLVQMIDADAGHRMIVAFTALIARAFDPASLPTLIPRLVTLVTVSAFLIVIAAALTPFVNRRQGTAHRERGVWW